MEEQKEERRATSQGGKTDSINGYSTGLQAIEESAMGVEENSEITAEVPKDSDNEVKD